MDKFNKCNNIYHSTIKMKPIDVKSCTYIDFDKENNKEDLGVLELVIMQEYQNIKEFLQMFKL